MINKIISIELNENSSIHTKLTLEGANIAKKQITEFVIFHYLCTQL